MVDWLMPPAMVNYNSANLEELDAISEVVKTVEEEYITPGHMVDEDDKEGIFFHLFSTFRHQVTRRYYHEQGNTKLL